MKTFTRNNDLTVFHAKAFFQKRNLDNRDCCTAVTVRYTIFMEEDLCIKDCSITVSSECFLENLNAPYPWKYCNMPIALDSTLVFCCWRSLPLNGFSFLSIMGPMMHVTFWGGFFSFPWAFQQYVTRPYLLNSHFWSLLGREGYFFGLKTLP